MTLEECIEALKKVIPNNMCYSDSNAIVPFDSHMGAILAYSEARKALQKMIAVSEGISSHD